MGDMMALDLNDRLINGFAVLLNDRFGLEAPDSQDFGHAKTFEPSIRSLWAACALSADDFAEEVSAFFNYLRITLSELMEATSCAGRFARRFFARIPSTSAHSRRSAIRARGC